MRRVVSLFLPRWSSDRLRRRLGRAAPPPEAPVVLIGRDGPRRVVLAVDDMACELGLRPGMTASQAHALLPGLQAHEADPEGDRAALERLALWTLRLYSPIVAADPPDGLVIDAGGAAHLRGGEEAMLTDLVERLAAAGLQGRAAMAATWGAAHALARHRAAPVLVVGHEATGEAIADLPVSALRLPAGLVTELSRLGFDRIGELEAQPRAALALRFGPEPGRRLDQAFGRLEEPVTPVRPPDMVHVRRVFAEPIGAPETLVRHTHLLVADLCTMLEMRSLGARRLDLLFHRVDNRIEALRVGTAQPARNAARLTRLLCERLETIDPGFGIERMTLSAPAVEPLRYRPAATSLGEAPEPNLAELIEVLANRVGPDRLYRLAAVESDVPERSVRRIAPLAGPTTGRWPLHWPRPVRLLPRPEPIEVIALLPDAPPARFAWRGIRHRVRRADGPERIHGEWARQEAELSAVRDYFQVEVESGARFWLFRSFDETEPGAPPHRWFLHGVFG